MSEKEIPLSRYPTAPRFWDGSRPPPVGVAPSFFYKSSM